MKCPVDKKDMIVVEHQKIELDYCLQCTGVWFDASELELLVATLRREGANISQNELLTPRQATVKEAARKCPHCGSNMDKVWLGKQPKVLIDSCPRGHGLWFDGGELQQVLCQLEPSDKKGYKDVMSFLGDTFKADCKK
jgi:Zn-finger nucleic acid-binding protein